MASLHYFHFFRGAIQTQSATLNVDSTLEILPPPLPPPSLTSKRGQKKFNQNPSGKLLSKVFENIFVSKYLCEIKLQQLLVTNT